MVPPPLCFSPHRASERHLQHLYAREVDYDETPFSRRFYSGLAGSPPLLPPSLFLSKSNFECPTSRLAPSSHPLLKSYLLYIYGGRAHRVPEEADKSPCVEGLFFSLCLPRAWYRFSPHKPSSLRPKPFQWTGCRGSRLATRKGPRVHQSTPLSRPISQV